MKRPIALTALCLLVVLAAGCNCAHNHRDMKPVNPASGASGAADSASQTTG